MMRFRHIVEIKSRLATSDDLQERIRSGKNAFVRGHDIHQVIGRGCLIKVNASVGMSRSSDLPGELAKVKAVETMRSGPDLMMDLSVCRPNLELIQAIRQHHRGPIGSLPHYVLASETSRTLEIDSLLSEMQSQINAGVTFFTIHPTPNIRLVEMALHTRRTPFTSRGGGLTRISHWRG